MLNSTKEINRELSQNLIERATQNDQERPPHVREIELTPAGWQGSCYKESLGKNILDRRNSMSKNPKMRK